MLSFHNDPAIKAKYLERVAEHAKADRLVQGTGWDGFKGCAVGCTLEAYDHSRYPIELGIPEWLARLEDSIFEGLAPEAALQWPQRFLNAVPVGVDLGPLRHQLGAKRMDRLIELQTSINGDKDYGQQVIAACRAVKEYNLNPTYPAARSARVAAWSAAESAARSAAESAESATESAARSAAESAWSAWAAAESAARSALHAARSAESALHAARSAAWSAGPAAGYAGPAARSAERSAERDWWKVEADALIQLLGEL